MSDESTASASVIRSPSYPIMSLERAVEATRKIETRYRSSPVDRGDGAKLIGFSSLSGPANKALAALAAYGLIERAGKGEMRVTPRARAILHPENASEKHRALSEAALEPHLYRELRDRFQGVTVPPVEGVVSYLNRQGFNQSAIRPAAKAFLDTLEFLESSGANESHSPPAKPSAESSLPEVDEPTYGGAKVGDLIQWESQGTLQFDKPLRVRLVSEDGAWVAVEGSETGIPMDEVIVEERAPAPPNERVAPSFPLGKPGGDGPALIDGEAEWIRSKLSKATDVRLLVRGDIGPREIGKLIRILEAQKAVLEDEDEAE